MQKSGNVKMKCRPVTPNRANLFCIQIEIAIGIGIEIEKI